MSNASPSKRIMVVDDDPGICETLQLIISSQTPHEVETCTNPLVALEQARQNRFHLVLTDIHMPGMDGLTLLRELKARDPEVEVIVLTGYLSPDKAISALQERAYDFIGKPFEVGQVLRSVANALAHGELSHGLQESMARAATSAKQLRARTRERLVSWTRRDRAEVVRAVLGSVAFDTARRMEAVMPALEALQKVAVLGPQSKEIGMLVRVVRDALQGAGTLPLPVGHLRPDPRLRTTDMGPLLEERLQMYRECFPDITFERAGANKVIIDLDEEAVAIAIDNLLDNAVAAVGPHGTVRAAIEVAGNAVLLSIEDTGHGFEPQALVQAGEPFVPSRRDGGIGLGLHLARRITEQHGGALRASNLRQGGARVELWFPRWRH